MRVTKRHRFVALVSLAILITYPSLLAYRFINYSGGSLTSSGIQTALMEAASRGDLSMMRLLLIVGANPNKSVVPGAMAPLAIAAREGWDGPAAMLLDYGASPNGATPIISEPSDIATLRPSAAMAFDRPMFYAASRGHQKVADILRRRGAQYQIWDAIFLGDDQVLDQLFSTAKDTAQFKEQLQHALGIAASQNNIGAARRLVKLGGDPFDRGGSILSAYDLALSEKNTELVAEFELYRKTAPTPSI